jgi:16S rRNA U516 pseudouridylate synthase RsuA-like enzyme
MEEMRLQKFLSEQGVLSRRAAEEEIKKGKVKVNFLPSRNW